MVVAVPFHKIAYMAVPKAACSSVKATLATIDPDIDITFDMLSADVELAHAVYPTMRFRPHRWEEYEGWWRFTVLRDPLKRLLSVYTDRVVARKELHNSPKLRKQTVLSVDPDPDFFFQNLADYSRKSSVIKHHALPVKLFIGPKPLLYDRIFTINQLGDLETVLSERVGQTVKIPRFNSSGRKINIDDLQPQTREIIAETLAPDYDHLSDYFENPFI